MFKADLLLLLPLTWGAKEDDAEKPEADPITKTAAVTGKHFISTVKDEYVKCLAALLMC